MCLRTLPVHSRCIFAGFSTARLFSPCNMVLTSIARHVWHLFLSCLPAVVGGSCVQDEPVSDGTGVSRSKDNLICVLCARPFNFLCWPKTEPRTQLVPSQSRKNQLVYLQSQGQSRCSLRWSQECNASRRVFTLATRFWSSF